MKIANKIFLCMLVMILAFSFVGNAFAAMSAKKTWSSSVCKSSFTTSAYITKGTFAFPYDESYWDLFIVTPTSIEHSNGSVPKLNATPKCTDGTTMGNKTSIWEDESKEINSNTWDTDKTNVKLLIANPYTGGNSNMKSAGNFEGVYLAA